jgi:hypothetical protein
MKNIVVLILMCVLVAIAAPGQIIVAGGGVPIGIPDGAAIWYGAGAPLSTVGADGDYYLDNNIYCLYGPKNAGSWPTVCVSSVRQLGYVAESVGSKGVAGGYAALDSNALIPAANLVPSVAVNGTSVPINTAPDQTVVTTSAAVGSWAPLPTCPDTGGNHLNYSLVIHGFLCGHTGGTAGSVDFGGVGSGSNANALTVSGTLSYTAGGLVNANQLGGVSLGSLATGLLKITSGTGIPSAALASDVTGTLGFAPENTANRNAANGYAPIDLNKLIPLANLPPIPAISGTSVPSNNASDQTVVTSSPAVGVWTSLPSCPDTGGNHLNYNSVNHGFLCGTTGGTTGSVVFSGVQSGTNAGALLIGGSLNYTGVGQINANQIGGVSLGGLSTGLLKITAGTGRPSVATVTDVTSTLGFTPENSANRGGANGYAPLNSSSAVPLTNLPVIPFAQTSGVQAVLAYTAENAANKGAVSGYAALDSSAHLMTSQMPALAGDISSSGVSATVKGLQGRAVANTAPASNQVLQWNGAQWAPGTVSGGNSAVTSAFGRTGDIAAQAGDYTYSQIVGTLPDAALPSDAVTTSGLSNSTLTAALTSLATTSDIAVGGALTATGNVYANAGSNAPGCLHLSDANGTHDMGLCAPSAGFNGLLNLWNSSGAMGQVTTSDGANSLQWSNLGGITGTLTSAQMPALGGDITNSGLIATVTGLRGRMVASTAPIANQVLQWNGSQWAPGTVSGSGAVSTVFGRAGVVTASAGDYAFGQISGAAAPAQLPGAAPWSGTLGNFTIGPGAGGSGNGSNNVAVGFGNLTVNTSGYQNVAIGQNALGANTTGVQNVAVGSLAMTANTTGSFNTAVGENALGNNTIGYNNFAFGLRALFQNTTGYNNSAFGIDSVGINTTGYRNSGYGTDSCAWNVTGYENACMGMNALWSLTTGYDDAATGFNAMFGATSGHYLTGVGAYADLYYPNTSTGVTLAATSNTANLSIGWYWYKVSFVLNGQETALSNNSYLGVLTDTIHKEVTITGLPTYTGPFTASARRIYRTPVCPTTLCTVVTANQMPRRWYYVAAVGDNTTTAYVDNTADASLGPEESGTPGKSIALGAYATVYGSYQMVVGSDPSPIQQIWLGNGMVTATAPASVLVSSSGASGTNIPGEDFILGGGPGTGSANGGNVIFGTAPGGGAGSTWNTLVNRWKIDSATGNLVALSTGGIVGVAGTVNLSGAAHTMPAKAGPGGSKPVTCAVGEQYFVTDAAAGQNLFGCTAVNIWTLEGGGGGAVASIFGRAGTVTAQSGDYTTTQVTEGANLYFTATRAAAAAPVPSVFGRTGAVTPTANDYNLGQISAGTLNATGGTVYNPAGSGNTQVIFKNSSSQAGNGIGPVLWENNAGNTMSFINWDGGFAEGDGANYKISLDTTTLGMSSDSLVAWHSVNSVFAGTLDTGLARESAGILKITNGFASYGILDAGGLRINGSPLATVAASGSYTDLINQPALAGDVSGGISTNTVGKIQNRAVANTAPSDGQVITWNASGNTWQPGNSSTGVATVFGRTGSVTAQAGDYTAAQVTNSLDATQTYSNPNWLTAVTFGGTSMNPAGGTVYNNAAGGNTQLVVRAGANQSTSSTAMILFKNSSGGNIGFINWDGGYASGDGTNYKYLFSGSTLGTSSDAVWNWKSTNSVFSGSYDVGLARGSAGIVKVTNGAAGYGAIDSAGYSASGTAGITSTTCTQWTNGLCTHN